MTDKAPDAPERKLYKGDDVPATALVGQRFIPLQALEPFEGARTPWGTAPAVKPPRLMVLDDARGSAYGTDYVRLTVLEPRNAWRKRVIDLPKTHALRALTGRMAATIREELVAYQAGHIGETITPTTMHLGSDPEIFVEDASGACIPAFTFLPSKASPRVASQLHGRGKYNHVYWDGFQAEFDTSPDLCLAYHVDSVRGGLQGVWEAMPAGARLSLRSVVEIPQDVLDAALPEHVEFGCAPSKNAYGLAGNISDGRRTPFRFAGGHIHMGFHAKPEAMEQAVRGLDAIAGVCSVSLFASFDNPVRREYYGLPGEYRLPAHGLEYRTLSNAWLMHPATMHLMFDLARQSARFGMSGLFHALRLSQDEWVDIIRRSDVESARKAIVANRTQLESIIGFIGGYYGMAKDTVNIILAGAESLVKDPTDIPGNWNLGPAWGWIQHSDGPGKHFGRAVRDFLRAGHRV